MTPPPDHDRPAWLAYATVALLVALSLLDLAIQPRDAIRRWVLGTPAK